jgi:hypothetical protein
MKMAKAYYVETKKKTRSLGEEATENEELSPEMWTKLKKSLNQPFCT